ncbi:sensor histidine kinase [Streptomyces sp. NPDC050145]|uniref:sensor histidine kinase n=1 Tax=Streptomyces sp. NPDC050145 TaxID=3365602 RepID=UPI0037A5867A
MAGDRVEGRAGVRRERGEAEADDLGTLLRSLRRDLLTFERRPLPPLSRPRFLRWAPHLLLAWITLGTTLSGLDQIGHGYHLGAPAGVALMGVQGGAMLLALWRPALAFWLSLLDSVLVARLAMPWLSGQAASGEDAWPWAAPSVIAHGAVLLLLALRVPTRATVVAFALSALAGPLLQGTGADIARYASTTLLSVVVFAIVALLGAALRGRSEARNRLVAQEEITAEERARRTVLEERANIARELHDVVAHHMSVISIQAQVAPHLVENPPDALKENLDGIRASALEALAELRRVLGVLRAEPAEDAGEQAAGFDDPGTAAAPQRPQPTLDRLDTLVAGTRAAGLAVTVLGTGERRPLPPGVELSAYRIVQEALSNALRHAPGSTVEVALDHRPDGLGVRVTNTAPERPAAPSPGAGHGLLGMRERAGMLGGTLATGPVAETGGYEVRAFLPATGGSRTDSRTGSRTGSRTDSSTGRDD